MHPRLAAITDESLDPMMQDAGLPAGRTEWQPDPESDGMDPATPGGPAPYNGAEPFGEPVATDPEWLDPRDRSGKDQRMPYQPGPDVDVTTLHRARRESYQKEERRAMSVDMLWSEASRDLEAENARLRMTRAKVATASLWPFLSLARSEREFEHRLALTADRINDRVEPELIGPLVASLREDFRLTASSEEDETEDGDDGEWQKPWEKTSSLGSASQLQIFHVASGRWITVQADSPMTRDNPEATEGYFEDALEEGPNTGQTGQYPVAPAGPDPWNPINSQYPMQPSPWTPANNWVENPMNFAPYRQAAADPYYFSGGPEGISGEPQGGFPVDVALPEPDERVDAYGAVPPVQSSGTTGDGHPYSSSPAANRATGSRLPFTGRFYDPGDSSVRVLAVGGPYGSGNAYNPSGSEVGIGSNDAPAPPPTMMPGGPGTVAMPPMDENTPMTDMTDAEADRSVTAAQTVRDRPDIFNPAGVQDEYVDNTWDAAAQQRPMQPSQHRNVNTPQQPQDPIPQSSSSGVYESDERRQAMLTRAMREIVASAMSRVAPYDFVKLVNA